jgi:hypothetical protein
MLIHGLKATTPFTLILVHSSQNICLLNLIRRDASFMSFKKIWICKNKRHYAKARFLVIWKLPGLQYGLWSMLSCRSHLIFITLSAIRILQVVEPASSVLPLQNWIPSYYCVYRSYKTTEGVCNKQTNKKQTQNIIWRINLYCPCITAYVRSSCLSIALVYC